MTAVEAAWVGAMVEAEGSVVLNPRYQRVDVINTDPEILSAMLRATGAGTVIFKPNSNPRYRPGFYWTLCRRLEIRELVRQCSGYSMKLQRLQEV